MEALGDFAAADGAHRLSAVLTAPLTRAPPVLSDEEQAAFHASIAGVRNAASRALQQRSGAAHLIAFIAQLHSAVDDVALRAAQTGPVPDCKPGCTFCCSVRVEATEPEIFRIARTIRQRPANEVAALVEALRQRVAADSNRQGDAAARQHTRQPCTFLDGALCSIYAVRPANCRKAHSLSVQQCAAFAPVIPQNLKLLLDAEALMAGTAEAYRDDHLAASPHELLAAVLQALTDASAESRWAAGAPAFRAQAAPDAAPRRSG